MALDPLVEQLIKLMPADVLPEGDDTAEHARLLQSERRVPVPAPTEVASVDNRKVPGPNGDIPVRVYRPKNAPAGALPCVMFYHGGGFVLGDLDGHDEPCRMLANQSGCVVVSVDYRLAPEHRYPQGPEDSYASLAYVAKHADEFGVDAARIAVAGDSAGGNMAAVAAMMARDRSGPAVRFQALIYPVIDHNFETTSYIDNAKGYLLTNEGMRWFWRQYLNSAEEGAQPYASPIRAESLAGLPPALVITAEYDPLRDEGEAYAARLEQHGVKTRLHRYDGMVHGFFQLHAFIPQGKQCIQECADAIRQALAAPAGTHA